MNRKRCASGTLNLIIKPIQKRKGQGCEICGHAPEGTPQAKSAQSAPRARSKHTFLELHPIHDRARGSTAVRNNIRVISTRKIKSPNSNVLPKRSTVTLDGTRLAHLPRGYGTSYSGCQHFDVSNGVPPAFSSRPYFIDATTSRVSISICSCCCATKALMSVFRNSSSLSWRAMISISAFRLTS